MPSNLTEICEDAFRGCVQLVNIRIPETVKKIGFNAFYGYNTDKIVIPDTVEIVEEGNKIVPDCLEGVKAKPHADSVTLLWKDVNDASGYTVFIRNNGKWNKILDVKPQTSQQYVYAYPDNLDSNTKYTFAVRPYNKVNGKTYWAPKFVKVTVTTLLEKPTAKVSSTKTGRVTVTWSDIDNETGYQIWYSTKETSGYKKLSNYKANVTSATAKGFTSGKKYYFKVRAYKKVNDEYIYSDYTSPIKIKIK